MPQDALYPLEFFIEGVPVSQGGTKSKGPWKTAVASAARRRQLQTVQPPLLDVGALAVTIYYFPAGPMEGDIDNIIKPIVDALVGTVYLDDDVIERVVSQKFEPQVDWGFGAPCDQLAAAFDRKPPVVYVRVDDDLGWRRL